LPPPFAGAVTPTAHMPPPGVAVIAAKPVSDPVPTNHRPHAVLTLQDERIVIARRSVDVPTDCPGRAICRCRSGKPVVFAGAPVGSCLYEFSARYSRSHKGRVRHGVRLLLAHDSQYRRRAITPTGNTEAEGSAGLQTTLQLVAFQCSISAWLGNPAPACCPTA
jgi:hypothetical protein